MTAQLSAAPMQALMARLGSSSSAGAAPPSPPAAYEAALQLAPDDFGSEQGAQTATQLLHGLSQGFVPTPEQCRKLVAVILSAATRLAQHDGPAPPPAVLTPLCTILKFLGRNAAGTEELARRGGIKALLLLGGLARVANLQQPVGKTATVAAGSDPATTAANDNDDDDDDDANYGAQAARVLEQLEPDPLTAAEQEALRCLANTLTLHPSAREHFPGVLLQDPNRAELYGLVRLLPCRGAGFLGGRLLFLLTSRPSELVGELVVDGRCVGALQQFADRYLQIYRSEDHRALLNSVSSGNPSLEDTLREHLKLAYNLMLQYARAPQVVPDGSGPAPAKSTFPDSHSTPSATTATEPSATTKSAGQETASDSLSVAASELFLPLFQPYLALSVNMPLDPVPPASTPTMTTTAAAAKNAKPTPLKEPSSLVRAALNALLHFPLELEERSGWATSWLQYVPPRISPGNGTVLRGGGIGSLGERLLELLAGVCEAYYPADRAPPHPKIYTQRDREQGRTLDPPCAPDEWIPTEGGVAAKIDEILGPVLLLLRKLSMLGEAQFVFRNLLFPHGLDRTHPIDRHPTLAGHLVRLLSSILLPHTAFGVGEFLYNLSDRSPETLVRAIGYGNASGFLQNRGELTPPSASATGGSSGGGGTEPRINPITGAFDPVPSARDEEEAGEASMSEAEKEQEAERLYTLFERLARTGVVSTPNPVARARDEGRFEETSEEREAERARLEREEQELEKEVEADMREWRARRKQVAAAGTDPAQAPS